MPAFAMHISDVTRPVAQNTNHLPRGHESSEHINIQSTLNRSTILNNVQVGLTKILKRLKEAVLVFFKSKNFSFYYYIVTIIKKIWEQRTEVVQYCVCHALNHEEHRSGSARPNLQGICKAPQKSRHKISDTLAL